VYILLYSWRGSFSKKERGKGKKRGKNKERKGGMR
jgi:hypothetical protein